LWGSVGVEVTHQPTAKPSSFYCAAFGGGGKVTMNFTR